MKKGFTLIELLGVILILGIIATIAIPIMLNAVSDAKEKTNEESLKMYIKAVDNKLASLRIHHRRLNDGEYEIMKDGNICLSNIDSNGSCTNNDILEIEYSGNKIESGYIIINGNKIISVEYVKIGNYAYSGDINNLSSIETNSSIVKTPDECFIIDSNDSSIISGYDIDNSKCPKNVTIPSRINGIEIKAIGDESFLGKELESVIIPNGINKIGNIAFADNKLTSLTMPDSIEEIGESSFEGNIITNLKLSSNLKVISKSSFAGNQLVNLVLPDSIEEIGEQAFFDSQISNLKIGSSVKVIGENAFADNKLINLVIPGNVEEIGFSAFHINKISNLKIENGVKKIDGFAFSENYLTSIDIPNSVTTIGESAFVNNNLKNLKIGSEIIYIGLYAFANTNTSDGYGPNELENIIINSNESNVSYTNAFDGFNGTICFLKDDPTCGN